MWPENVTFLPFILEHTQEEDIVAILVTKTGCFEMPRAWWPLDQGAWLCWGHRARRQSTESPRLGSEAGGSYRRGVRCSGRWGRETPAPGFSPSCSCRAHPFSVAVAAPGLRQLGHLDVLGEVLASGVPCVPAGDTAPPGSGTVHPAASSPSETYLWGHGDGLRVPGACVAVAMCGWGKGIAEGAG